MDYYDKIAPGYNELYGNEQLNKLRLIKEHITKENGLLLDVGAGTGLSQYVFRDHSCVSIDPSEGMLAHAEGMKLKGTAESLPFKDKTFDVVIAVTSLHHCDAKKALEEIERVVKDDGEIAVSMLKKAKFDESLFKEYKRIEEEKDILFIRTRG